MTHGILGEFTRVGPTHRMSPMILIIIRNTGKPPRGPSSKQSRRFFPFPFPLSHRTLQPNTLTRLERCEPRRSLSRHSLSLEGPPWFRFSLRVPQTKSESFYSASASDYLRPQSSNVRSSLGPAPPDLCWRQHGAACGGAPPGAIVVPVAVAPQRLCTSIAAPDHPTRQPPHPRQGCGVASATGRRRQAPSR